ncbi:unnamed protein product [Pedinophyceae sp. YPF-701]|nr:unnamed protein product [Pedinophyceae sp. YPF-701]
MAGEAEQKSYQDPWREGKVMLSGGIAGVVSRSTTAPIDRAKMIMQVAEGSHMNMRQAFKVMLAEGSIRSWFRGNGANCAKIGPEMALKLTINDEMKKIVYSRRQDAHIPAWQRLAFGGLSGAVAQACIYPMEVVRTRLAVCAPGSYNGMLNVLTRTYQQEGVKALYRGLTPSLIGIIPYAGVDIAVFEIIKSHLVEVFDGDLPNSSLLAAGAASASLAQFVSYPFAVVRTRLQAQGAKGHQEKYEGMIDAFRKTYRHEGVRGLYRGLTPNMLKLAPAAAISWWSFEQSKLALGINIRT